METLGKGVAAFGSGAAAGNLALYGTAGWAAGGALVGGTNAWLGGAKGLDIVTSAGVGAISGLAGEAAGSWASTSVGGVLINGFNVTSPVLKGVIGGAIGGAAGGYAGGFVAGGIMTGTLKGANQAGLNGLYSGAALGAVSGGIGGYKAAKQNQLNPWTGKSTRPIPTKTHSLDFTPNPNGENISMYRGVTGNENANGPLFMAETPEYAASYSAEVVKITINRIAFKDLYYKGEIQPYRGENSIKGSVGGEYLIQNQQLKIYIIKILKIN